MLTLRSRTSDELLRLSLCLVIILLCFATVQDVGATRLSVGPYMFSNPTYSLAVPSVSWTVNRTINLTGISPDPLSVSTRYVISKFSDVNGLSYDADPANLAGIIVRMNVTCLSPVRVIVFAALQDSTISGTNKTYNITPPLNAANYQFGSSIDTWDAGFAQSDLHDSNFGFQFYVQNRAAAGTYFQIFSSNIDAYIYQDVIITSVTPVSQIGLRGLGRVKISGSGFYRNGLLRANFGSKVSTCTWNTTDNTLSCAVPDQTSFGSYEVYVSMDGGTTFTNETDFTFDYIPASTTAPTSGLITTRSPTSGRITSSAVTSSAITSSPITSSPLTSASITSSPITSASITSAPITSASITSAPISSASVTSSDVTSASVTSSDPIGLTSSISAGTSGASSPTTMRSILTSGSRTSSWPYPPIDITTNGPVVPDSSKPDHIANANAPNDRANPAIVATITVITVVLLVILIILLILTFRKRNWRGMKKPKFAELLFQADKSMYVVSKQDYTVLKRMEQLLFTPGVPIVKVVAQLSSINDSEAFARSIVILFAVNKQIPLLMSSMIKSECEIADSEGLLFRKSDFTSKLMKVYSTFVGLDFLYLTLGKVIREMFASHASHREKEDRDTHLSLIVDSIEMDPKKLANEDDVAVNRLQLQLLTQKVFNSVTKEVNSVPIALRYICATIMEETTKKFSLDAARRAVGGFFFFRYICPCLISPHLYFLVNEPPDSETQRRLLLVAKVLQNLSNGVQFGKKEEYMASLNSFITDNNARMIKFIDQISVLPDNWKDQMNRECVNIPESAQENASCLVFNQVHALGGRIEKELMKEAPDQVTDELSAVLANPAIQQRPVHSLTARASTRDSRLQV